MTETTKQKRECEVRVYTTPPLHHLLPGHTPSLHNGKVNDPVTLEELCALCHQVLVPEAHVSKNKKNSSTLGT